MLTGKKACTLVRRDRNGHPSAAAFTLTEVMVATAMLMVIFAGGFGALIQGNRLIEHSRDETRASQILQSEIEELRTYDWATLIALPVDSNYSPQSSFTESYALRYSVERKIQNRPGDQKRIRVKVTWTDNQGTDHEREFVTHVTKDGLFDYYYRTI